MLQTEEWRRTHETAHRYDPRIQQCNNCLIPPVHRYDPRIQQCNKLLDSTSCTWFYYVQIAIVKISILFPYRMNLCLFRNWSDPWTDTVSSPLFVSSFFDNKRHGSHHQQQLATSHPTSWISVVFRIRHEQQILCNSVVPVYHVDRFVKVQRLLRSSSPFQNNFDIL